MSRPPSLLIGALAGIGAALLASVWHVATRLGVTTDLKPIDLALLRYVIPALLLSPLILRNGLWPSGKSRWLGAAMFLGGGLPFGLLAMAGARYAPAAHMGALLPGTMPIFTALMAVALLGERIAFRRWLGFGVVGLSIALFAQAAFGDIASEVWIGDLLFLGAAAVWALFTVAFRRSGLDPWQGTAFLSVCSAVAVIPIWLHSGTERLLHAPLADLATQITVQGFVAGLAGVWTYVLAVRHLGASRAALSGALPPAFTAAGGIVFLGEMPGLAAVIGIVFTIVGIVVASWPDDK